MAEVTDSDIANAGRSRQAKAGDHSAKNRALNKAVDSAKPKSKVSLKPMPVNAGASMKATQSGTPKSISGGGRAAALDSNRGGLSKSISAKKIIPYT